MSELSIKIQIGGRTYPLTIERAEEEIIRKAAKEIDENIKSLQSSYAVKDKQDLLAMTALQMATKALQARSAEPQVVTADRELAAINTLLDQALQ